MSFILTDSNSKEKNYVSNETRKLSGWHHFTSGICYYHFHMGYLILTCFIGSIILCKIDDLPYIDGLFQSISAVTCTGLATVPMSSLSSGSFITLFFLIMFGGSLLIPIGPMLYRRYLYAQIKKQYPVGSVINENPVFNEYDVQDKALGIMIRFVITYILSWNLIAWWVMIGGMYLQDNEPNIAIRGYSRVVSAGFLSNSAFNNAGFALSDNSVSYFERNPVIYLTLSLIIIAGNTFAPVFYRLFLYIEFKVMKCLKKDVTAYKFIFTNPRRICVHTMPKRELAFLALANTFINFVEYIFFLSSTLDRSEAKDIDGDYRTNSNLAGMGFFQIISTRNAGLQIMDFRQLNQGMLLVFMVAMYLAGAPFTSAMASSIDTQDHPASIKEPDMLDYKPIENISEGASFKIDAMNIMAQVPRIRRGSDAEEEKIRIRRASDADEEKIRIRRASDADEEKIRIRRASDADEEKIRIRRGSGSDAEEVKDAQDTEPTEGLQVTRKNSERIQAPRLNSFFLITKNQSKIENEFISQYIFKHAFFIILSIFICIFAEDNLLNAKPADINVFYIIFEVISAYGNVGVSMNLPGTLYSVSGNFGILAKLSICFAMLLGKHREMPMVTDAVVDFKFTRLKTAVVMAQRSDSEAKRLLAAATSPKKDDSSGRIASVREPLEVEKNYT